MDRRRFLRTSLAVPAALSLPEGYAALFDEKPKRVGIIGPGWYGKCDLFRLIQVAPVEVVSLCDVDRQMLARGGRIDRRAPGVEEAAAHLRGLPQDARREGPRHRPDRHARPLARARHDRRRARPAPCLLPEADQRGRCGRPGHARRRAQVQARGAGRHAAPQHAALDRSARPDRPRGQTRQGGTRRDLLLLPHARRTQPARHAPPPDTWIRRCGPAPRRMRPYNAHGAPARWRAFMEYGNGIIGDMCIHMLDMVRWMLDLGWPQAHRVPSGGILRAKEGCQGEHHPTRKSPPSTSATSTVVWQHRTWGSMRRIRNTPGARRSTVTRGR